MIVAAAHDRSCSRKVGVSLFSCGVGGPGGGGPGGPGGGGPGGPGGGGPGGGAGPLRMFSWLRRGAMPARRIGIRCWLVVLLDVPRGAAVTSCRRVVGDGLRLVMLLLCVD